MLEQADHSQVEKRPHPMTVRIGVWGVAIAAGGLLVAAATYLSTYGLGSEKQVGIEVTADGRPVPAAEVGLGVLEVKRSYTDSQGQVFFPLSKDIAGKTGRISVRKNGYEPYDEQLLLQPRQDLYLIHLQPGRQPQPGTVPGRSGDATTHGIASPANTGSGSVTVNFGDRVRDSESKKKR